MSFEQADRLIRMASGPLGTDEVLVTGLSVHEAISQLYQMQVDFVSTKLDLKPADLVGKVVGLELERTDAGGQPIDPPRFFNGYINRFAAGRVATHQTDGFKYRSYRAHVSPWLWLLTQTARCFIYFPEKEDKTIYEVIEAVMDRAQGELGITEAKFDLSGLNDLKQRKVKHCVQYRESDFNFLSRILEQFGAYYYFKQEEGSHTLVLSTKKNYPKCTESEVTFPGTSGGQIQADHVTSWEHDYEFRSGKYSHTDYNFETPSTSLLQSSAKISGDLVSETSRFEVYDSPGEYRDTGEGSQEARIRQEQEEVTHNTVSGSSTCRTFAAGHIFELVSHPEQDAVSEQNETYLLTGVQHFAHQPMPETGSATAAEYSNHFECIPASIQYRARRRTAKPVVNGVQTAVVVGPAGEEIYTDHYGRVKVQFHWDREGQKDENSSCWVRSSQIHAGKSFGAIHLPRIGEEVIVDFVEGDPDRPIITGRVYNAENMPPYPLPDEKNISGMKSNSTLGGGGYNEYVFDDTKGNELIREHGEKDKDSTIENDLREHVLHCRSRDVSVNETIAIGNNRKKTIGKDETVMVKNDRTETVMKNEKITIGQNRTEMVGVNESVNIGSSRTMMVGSNNSEMIALNSAQLVGILKALTVGGAYQISVGGALNETVGAAKAEEVGLSSTESVGMAKEISAGTKFAVEAGQEIELKCGASSITMKASGQIEIKGTEIKMQAAAGKVHIMPGGIVDIKGPMVKINT